MGSRHFLTFLLVFTLVISNMAWFKQFGEKKAMIDTYRHSKIFRADYMVDLVQCGLGGSTYCLDDEAVIKLNMILASYREDLCE